MLYCHTLHFRFPRTRCHGIAHVTCIPKLRYGPSKKLYTQRSIKNRSNVMFDVPVDHPADTAIGGLLIRQLLNVSSLTSGISCSRESAGSWPLPCALCQAWKPPPPAPLSGPVPCRSKSCEGRARWFFRAVWVLRFGLLETVGHSFTHPI